jgi:hypothetical protein
MVHDVEFDGHLKNQLVAAGNRTPKVLMEEVFSSVVSMEAVHFDFIMAQLNGLLVCPGNVENNFFYGKTRKKVFTIAGPEFGSDLAGKLLTIDKLYTDLKAQVLDSMSMYHLN